MDWDGNPVPDTELAIEVSLAEWKNVQKKASDGQFYWATEVKETPVLTDSATTGADGKAVFTWTPEAGGQYKIKAIVTDQLGNEVRSSAFVWAGESGSDTIPWAIDNNDRIELVADKPLYQVGDTARVLVPHPFSGPVEALLTIERGEIIETQVITIDGNSETLEIPITEEHVPNIFVSVALVKGEDAASDALGSFKLGYAMLPVDPVVKELNVVLTASQSQLKPGESVTFDVQVTDNAGNPVETELSLALIDKALLSLASEQQSTLMDTFYRERGLGVQTASTLVYNLNRINQQLQEGAKGGGGGGDGMAGTEIRSEFQDAALLGAGAGHRRRWPRPGHRHVARQPDHLAAGRAGRHRGHQGRPGDHRGADDAAAAGASGAAALLHRRRHRADQRDRQQQHRRGPHRRGHAGQRSGHHRQAAEPDRRRAGARPDQGELAGGRARARRRAGNDAWRHPLQRAGDIRRCAAGRRGRDHRADPALQLAGDHRDRRHRGAGRGAHRGHRAAVRRRSDAGRAARAA